MCEQYDSHVHSNHSHDSHQSLEQICQSAIQKGLNGITITDHADMWFLVKDHTFEQIAASVAEAKVANMRYGDQLHVFSGVEISEYEDEPEQAQKILKLAQYDVVLGSVHSIRFADWDDSYSRIRFDQTVPPAKLYAFLDSYFSHLLHMAQHEDFDVLSHLTCPLRYINGIYKRGVTLEPFAGVIAEILSCILRRQRALEINTSGLHGRYDALLPDPSIIAQYYALGGRLITLASDAHAPERIGNAFSETMTLLKKIGFDGYYYYQNRQPRKILF